MTDINSSTRLAVANRNSGQPAARMDALVAYLQTQIGGGGVNIILPTTFDGLGIEDLANTTPATIGKTGSGADYEWADLDNYPDNCIVSFSLYGDVEGDGVTAGQNIEVNFEHPQAGTLLAFVQKVWGGPTADGLVVGGMALALMQNGLFTISYAALGLTVNGLYFLTNFCLGESA